MRERKGQTMRTSKAIKSRQYNRIEPKVIHNSNHYTFASESNNRDYDTHRAKSRFSCSCPAVGLCKHITKMVMDAAEAKGFKASVWTSVDDKARQKKKAVMFTANQRPFWVTFHKVEDIEPETVGLAPQPSNRTVRVRYEYDGRVEDGLEWMVENVQVKNGIWRSSKLNLDELMDLDGWTATKPRMIWQTTPGWFLWEFEMREVA
jgi:hypothetical protein